MNGLTVIMPTESLRASERNKREKSRGDEKENSERIIRISTINYVPWKVISWSLRRSPFTTTLSQWGKQGTWNGSYLYFNWGHGGYKLRPLQWMGVAVKTWGSSLGFAQNDRTAFSCNQNWKTFCRKWRKKLMLGVYKTMQGHDS